MCVNPSGSARWQLPRNGLRLEVLCREVFNNSVSSLDMTFTFCISTLITFSMLCFSKKVFTRSQLLNVSAKLFIIVLYYHLDFCKISIGGSRFVPDVANLCSFLFQLF